MKLNFICPKSGYMELSMYAYLIIYEASYLHLFLKNFSCFSLYVCVCVCFIFNNIFFSSFLCTFRIFHCIFIYCTFRYTLQHYNILFFKIKDFYIFFSIFFLTVCKCSNNNLNLRWCSCCYNNWLAKYNLWLSGCLLLSNWASFFSKSSYTFNTTCHYKG